MADGRTDAHEEVAGLLHQTAHGGHALHQRTALADRTINGIAGADVRNDHAHVQRQTAAGHLALRGGIDQLLFTALRVTHGQRTHLNTLRAGGGSRHGGYGVGLIVLNADDGLLHVEGLHHQTNAVNDAIGVLHHQPMIGRQVRLALRAVNDEHLDGLALGWAQLHRGGEGRAAQTHNASVAHDLLQFRRRQAFGMIVEGQLHPLILVVVINDDGHGLTAIGQNAGLNIHHRTGHGCVDRRGHEATRFTDELTHTNVVALLHQRLGGSADMLRQRNDDPRRRGQHFNGVQAIDCLAVFALVGMDSPGKQT